MPQINRIRELWEMGYTKASISRELSIDVKTVTKYIEQQDFSPKKPEQTEGQSILDPYKDQINTWLQEDQKTWKKQHHTAKRVHERLQETFSEYSCSYVTVQRYVKKIRETQMQKQTHQELVWEPGEAQADFGEADCIYQGEKQRLKYLTISFPHSNTGISQFFRGETAECVCQGLKAIFNHIGGVSTLLVVDNATGIGRRIGDKLQLAKLFSAFKAHYRLKVRFCNPDAGHEKGNVENKVGFVRRNEFVPLPVFDDIEAFNKELLADYDRRDDQLHYKKHIAIRELFKDDLKALRNLPASTFDVCRYQYRKANKYGNVQIDGNHHYSTRPEYGGTEVLVGIRSHWIDIYDTKGKLLTRHQRQYGKQRTDSLDYRTSLAVLMHNIGAWEQSGVRRLLGEPIRAYIDHLDRLGRKSAVRTLHALSETYSFEIAVQSLEIAIEQHGQSPLADAAALAARIVETGLTAPVIADPGLKHYDEFLQAEGVGA